MSQARPTDVEATRYAESFVIYGVKTKAFRAAFPSTKATMKTVNELASKFHSLPKVQKRIDELHESINQMAEDEALFSAKSAIEELEEARALAAVPNDNGTSQCSAMVSATMGKAKIAGLLVDTIHNKDITPPKIEYVVPDEDQAD